MMKSVLLKCRVMIFLLLLGFSLSISAIQTILVVGDSLSAAYGIQPNEGWVALLSQRLQKKGLSYDVKNISVSGYTTSNGLDVLPNALAEYHPSIVILALGSNDGLRGLSTNEMKNNLKQMILSTKASHAKLLLVGFLIPYNYGPVYRKQFENVFSELTAEFKLQQVPFLLKEVALNSDLMQQDGLHPNAKAQPIILETVWVYLEKML